MKTRILIIVITLFTALGMQAQKEMDAFEVQVDGLGCPFCAYGLEKKFKEFKGIKKVAIDIETGDFSFQYPSEKALTMEAVIKKVEKAGYTPITAKITRATGEIETKEANVTALTSKSEVVTQQLLVAGKCDMCKSRIENTSINIPGVTAATWVVDSRMLKVTFDKSQTTTDAIQKTVAEVGHDTRAYKTTQEGYDNLPACCKYERLDQ